MKNLIIFSLTLISIFCTNILSAQVMGVNTETPNAQAILDIFSTNKGLLIPRMTDGNIPTGVNGLMLYNTTDGEFNFFENGTWRSRSYPWAATATGNPYVFTPSVGIGITNPTFKLHVSTTSASMFMLNRTTSGTSMITMQNTSSGMTMGMASDGDFAVGTTTTINDDLLRIEDTGNVGELMVKNQIGGIVPCGGIIMWSGTSVPAGWALCNGSNGTPNLLDRFIQGGTTGQVGDTGGSNTKTLTTSNLPSHNHGPGTLKTTTDGSHKHDIGTRGYTLSGCSGCASALGADGSNDDQDADTQNAGSHSHIVVGSTADTGLGTSFDNRPSYYVLAFIMKKCN